MRGSGRGGGSRLRVAGTGTDRECGLRELLQRVLELVNLAVNLRELSFRQLPIVLQDLGCGLPRVRVRWTTLSTVLTSVLTSVLPTMLLLVVLTVLAVLGVLIGQQP